MAIGVEIHWFDEFFESGRWQLTLVVAWYAAIIWVTSRFLIAGPFRQEVVEEIAAERALLGMMKAEAASDADKAAFYELASKAIDDLLAAGVDSVSWTFRKRLHTAPFVTLTRVITARRYLHEAQLLRVRAFTEDHLALAEMSSARLRRAGIAHGAALAKQMDTIIAQRKRAKTASERRQADTELRLAVAEGIRLWRQDEDLDLDELENSQRRVFWLVTTGLALAFIVGLYGHRTTLLFGALGGFLSPLIRIRWRRAQADDYGASWGVLVLSPVAGALTAYGGILLITFLTSPDIELLGEALRKAGWDDSNEPISLTAALLFGFSARLFSSLALSAAGAVTPSAPSAEGATEDATEASEPASPPRAGADGGTEEAAAPATRKVFAPRRTKAGRGAGKSRPVR